MNSANDRRVVKAYIELRRLFLKVYILYNLSKAEISKNFLMEIFEINTS
jgi:hypothetical protein